MACSKTWQAIDFSKWSLFCCDENSEDKQMLFLLVFSPSVFYSVVPRCCFFLSFYALVLICCLDEFFFEAELTVNFFMTTTTFSDAYYHQCVPPLASVLRGFSVAVSVMLGGPAAGCFMLSFSSSSKLSCSLSDRRKASRNSLNSIWPMKWETAFFNLAFRAACFFLCTRKGSKSKHQILENRLRLLVYRLCWCPAIEQDRGFDRPSGDCPCAYLGGYSRAEILPWSRYLTRMKIISHRPCLIRGVKWETQMI